MSTGACLTYLTSAGGMYNKGAPVVVYKTFQITVSTQLQLTKSICMFWSQVFTDTNYKCKNIKALINIAIFQ